MNVPKIEEQYKIQYSNYMRVKNYYQLTKQMIEDYNMVAKEYQSITNNYIQKITQLKQNYSKTISDYETLLKYSGGKLKPLIQLLQRIISIFQIETEKLSSLLKGFLAISEENEINTEEIKAINTIANEYESEERKMSKKILDYDNTYINLISSYESTEDIITNYIVGKNSRRLSVDDSAFKLAIGKTLEKEKNFSKLSQEINEDKKKFYRIYDNFVNQAQKMTFNNIETINRNINIFLSLLVNYHKTTFTSIEKVIKNLSENEYLTDYSKILQSFIDNFKRETHKNKYKIKAVKNKILDNKIDEKSKKVIEELSYEMGYFFEDNKLVLRDEDIYNLVTVMYGQFEFVDNSEYNLVVEQNKIEVKKLSQRLLSFGYKKKKGFDTKNLKPLNETEIKKFFILMEKQSNRLTFLQFMNTFRALGYFEIPQTEFDLISKLFILIADKINDENDLECSKQIVILSQTFYIMKDNQKFFLQEVIKGHAMFYKSDLWKKYLLQSIEAEVAKSEVQDRKMKRRVSEHSKASRENNIAYAQLVPFCSNMVDFGLTEENILTIVGPLINKYKFTEEMKNVINGIIKANNK